MALGNTKGLKQTFLQRLDELKQIEVARGEFATEELLTQMAALTGECGREIAVYLARDGEILDVFIGTGEEILLPQMRLRRNENGLCGRCGAFTRTPKDRVSCPARTRTRCAI